MQEIIFWSPHVPAVCTISIATMYTKFSRKNNHSTQTFHSTAIQALSFSCACITKDCILTADLASTPNATERKKNSTCKHTIGHVYTNANTRYRKHNTRREVSCKRVYLWSIARQQQRRRRRHHQTTVDATTCWHLCHVTVWSTCTAVHRCSVWYICRYML